MFKRIRKKAWTIGLLAALVFASPFSLSAQDFVEGMRLFNQAKYDSLIRVFAPKYIEDHPEEEGLVRYFLGESFYNKAVVENDARKSNRLFKRAYSEFSSAASSPDMSSKHPEYYDQARYKLGWCLFRLAELNDDPLTKLQEAFSRFTQFREQAPDSIKLRSSYMAGKASLRLSLLELYNPAGLPIDPEVRARLFARLAKTQKLYDGIWEYQATDSAPHDLVDLKGAIALELLSLKYLLGKWYALLSFDGEKQNLSADDTERFVNKAETAFQDILARTESPESFKTYKGSIKPYYQMLSSLDRYLLVGSDGARKSVLTAWQDIVARELEAEKSFRRGSLHHGHPEVTSDDFRTLVARYYEASSDIPESSYWLGYLKMIQNDGERSRRHFHEFLERLGDQGDFVTTREQTLFEDAQLRKYLLDFEHLYLANRFRQLRTIANDLETFSPANEEIRKRKQSVKLIVHASITSNPSDLWTRVLTGSEDEKLAQAMSTITFVLPRAALNIGIAREKYLAILNRLFEITKMHRSDETLFFRGIAKTLEAEIQANPIEKSRTYLEAANILKAVSPNYVNRHESEYLRARCLFFADEFDEAEMLLRGLVNGKHSLRALFYLAEIFRYNGQGLAAKKCYQTIVSKFQNTSGVFDKYWLLNAQAGLEASNDEGDLSVLSNTKIQEVEFQPSLRQDQLTYEKLADERWLQRQLARESVQWLSHYGLPKKEIYPSKNRLPNSIFIAENIFENFPWALDEVRGPVTSALTLLVIASGEATEEAEVTLGTERLSGTGENLYSRPGLKLNSEHDLSVQEADYYPHKRRVKLRKAGENLNVVLLSKRVEFSHKSQVTGSQAHPDDPFAPRWDLNVVLNRPLPELARDSELVREFSNRHELRDCAFDSKHDRILVVNATENNVWVYSSETDSKKVGTLQLNVSKPLNSPEGIAVDSSGRIWIVDWGNHRILQFNSDGEQMREFGRFGTNHSDSDDLTKYVFPTRVTVLEDSIGTEVDGVAYYREDYLLVADQNGIHLSDMNGRYLDTVFKPTEEFPRGSFYSFRIGGYDERSTLLVLSRKERTAGELFLFEPD